MTITHSVESTNGGATLDPGVQLALFGSGSAGTARSTSDCDVLFVFPDGTPNEIQGQAVIELDVWPPGSRCLQHLDFHGQRLPVYVDVLGEDRGTLVR